jgi:hypothetical protein
MHRFARGPRPCELLFVRLEGGGQTNTTTVVWCLLEERSNAAPRVGTVRVVQERVLLLILRKAAHMLVVEHAF